VTGLATKEHKELKELKKFSVILSLSKDQFGYLLV